MRTIIPEREGLSTVEIDVHSRFRIFGKGHFTEHANFYTISVIEQNRALHDGLIYISASPLVAVLFFVYDYSNNISAKEKAL